MLWFTRETTSPTPDPIERICRLMSDRPFEWSAGKDEKKPSDRVLVHTSNVRVSWREMYSEDTRVWLAIDEQYIEINDWKSVSRLIGAIKNCAASRVEQATSSDPSVRLALAVLAGDKDKAIELAESVLPFAEEI